MMTTAWAATKATTTTPATAGSDDDDTFRANGANSVPGFFFFLSLLPSFNFLLKQDAAAVATPVVPYCKGNSKEVDDDSNDEGAVQVQQRQRRW
jgi:hypothetical protein